LSLSSPCTFRDRPSALAGFDQDVGAGGGHVAVRDYVMKAGWATASGSESPNGDVATACADILVKARQS
jgi:hypothetical protein